MSLHNRFLLPLALSALAALVGCGSNSTPPVPPPSGGFSNANLSGTYVFSTTGTDNVSGSLITIVGEFSANGSGGITGGTFDALDPNFTSIVSFQPISSNSVYKVTADGRGTATLGTNSVLGTITLDYVLSNSSHGLVTEFDGNGTGSGTLDLQSVISQSQLTAYAFSLSGIDSNGNPLSSAGAFTLNGSTGITAGVQDLNDFGFLYSNLGLGGTVTLNSDGATGTAALSTTFGSLTFDFYAIDATHMKLIETDDFPITSGDAFSQASAATTLNGALAFTLGGLSPANGNALPVAAGGFIVADGAGNITNASTEDVNSGGSPTSVPLAFSGPYSVNGPRSVLTLTGMFPGSTFVGYPSSGGLLLLEMDTNGVTSGAALPQSSTNLADTEGYGLNLTAINLGVGVEVDDISEFTAASATSNPNMTGRIDENSAPSTAPLTFNANLSGTYQAPDSSGRGFVVVPSVNTINGGFGLIFYTVDGSNFLFIESDTSGQVGTGSFELQNASESALGKRVFARPMKPMTLPKAAAKAAWKHRK